jgi:secreted trypsin-like serine protease
MNDSQCNSQAKHSRHLSSLVFTCLLVFLSSFSMAHAIINGYPAKDANYVVALVDMLNPKVASCTGAYLKPKVVITAAHCVIKFGEKAPNLRIPVSRLMVSQPGINLNTASAASQFVRVESIWTKESYFNRFDNLKNWNESAIDDVAIILLEKELQGKTIDRVATLLEIEAFKAGIGEGFQLGYGCINGNSEQPAPNDGIPYQIDGLKGTQKTEKVISDSNKFLQFEYPKGTANCPGDSGGPILQKIGEEVVYLGTLFGGGGASEILRKVPNIRAFGNATVTWPYLAEMESQLSKWAKEAEERLVAEKAAAELKAKQQAEAKAAAELKAKQEAEAKAAQSKNKKTTITCVKGKLTKKVTAINPKCPKGSKKVMTR